MTVDYVIRSATAKDAADIARLIDISSDGVATIEWHQQAQRENCDPLDIGTRIYQNPEGNYSWKNCTVVERSNKIAGMLLTFAMPDNQTRDINKRPHINDTDVFAPYLYLEEPNSWYICGIAFYPEHRGQGLGSRLMQLANEQAKDNGFTTLSLVAFEQNKGSVHLYERLGFRITDHAPVIPHPLIRHTGEAVLMIADVK